MSKLYRITILGHNFLVGWFTHAARWWKRPYVKWLS